MPRKPSPGRPPLNLEAVVGYRDTPQGQQPVTVIDRVEETIRMGGFLKDAAARIGVSVDRLREWRTVGNRCLREVLAGERRRSQMTRHEKLCAELAAKIDQAEADARTHLLGLAQRMARGGLTRKETTVRRDARGAVVEETTREADLLPDTAMIQWLLTHRWPEDFGRTRLEVSGPDGAGIPLDTAPIAEQIRDAIADARSRQAETSREALEEALAGGRNGHQQGNGHHP